MGKSKERDEDYEKTQPNKSRDITSRVNDRISRIEAEVQERDISDPLSAEDLNYYYKTSPDRYDIWVC